MLEFYPMPTNLNQGSSIYALQHNHAAARFLDNPATATTTNNNNNCMTNCNGSNNNNNNNLQTNLNAAATTSLITTLAVASGTTTAATAAVANVATKPPIITTPAAAATHTCPAITTTTASAAAAAAAAAAATTAHNNNNNSICLTPNNTNSSLTAAASAVAAAAAAVAAAAATATATATATASSTAVAAAAAAAAATTTAVSPTSASSSTLTALAAASTKLSADCSGRTEVGHIKCEKNYEICEGCGQKIHDRYLMNVGDANWHEQCLACCYCGMQLHHTCYVRNTKIYCKLDYDRLFGIKCAACCHPILPQELVMRPITNFIFHLPCFVCYACRLPLQKGEQFMLRDGQLFCYRHDLEKEMFLAAAQHCGFVGLDDEDLLRPRDGRRGPKRPRTILTSQQRKQFKASFDQSPKPCRKVREALAKDTGLSVRVVQVWFQNQRAKMKKIQRKAKNGGTAGAVNSNGSNGRGANGATGCDADKELDKDEKCGIKQEGGSDNSYLGIDSIYASQPLNPNLPFSPDDYPTNSNDSFCSSDLSLDGSNFDHLDDDTDSLSLNNLELQSTSSSGNQHSNPHDMLANLNSSLINPIDKLYLMQNSYFNTEQ